MTAAREAFYLPLLFLTVTLLGGVRLADRVILLPPSLFSLVLALLLLGVLVKSGALAPERLMNAGRSAIANVNGFVVLVTLFVASAQAFSLATPESGLPHLLFCVFLLTLLLNTLAAGTDRVRTLRSLLVIFGSAFILKFIVLAALSDQTGGPLRRVLLVLLEGVTLGTLTQDVIRPGTGYLAFFTLTMLLIGLGMLPWRDTEKGPDVVRPLMTLMTTRREVQRARGGERPSSDQPSHPPECP
jgi:hypothetical protein